MYELIVSIINALPPSLHLSPITVAGVGIAGIAMVLYFITRCPEMLLVVLTAVAYAIVPVLPTLA